MVMNEANSSTEIENLSIASEEDEDNSEYSINEIPINDIEEALTHVGFGFGTLLHIAASYIVISTEAMAIEVLAIVGLIVRCDWNLSTIEMTAIQVCGVLSQLVFALVFSNITEKFGRKKVMLGGMILMTVFGVLSGVVSQHLWELILFRTLIGATIGLCDPAASIYPGEVTPFKWRTYSMLGIGIAWGIGYTFTCLVAYFVLEPYGWRGLLIGCSVLLSPGIIVVGLARESPMFDLYRGKVKEAESSLSFIAKLNRKKLRRLLKFDQQEGHNVENTRKTIREILQTLLQTGKTQDLAKLTVLIAVGVSAYTSIGYATPRLTADLSENNSITTENSTCSFTKSELVHIGLVGLSEPIAVIISAYISDKLGRRNSNWAAGAITLLCLVGLYFQLDGGVQMALLLVLRGTSSLLIYLPQLMLREHMPVSVRGFCFHLGFVAARIVTTIMIATTHFAYEENPKVLVGIIQGLVVVAVIVQFFFKGESQPHLNLSDEDLVQL